MILRIINNWFIFNPWIYWKSMAQKKCNSFEVILSEGFISFARLIRIWNLCENMNKEIRTHKEELFHQMTCLKIIMMNTLTPSYSFSKSDLFLNNSRFFLVVCLIASVLFWQKMFHFSFWVFFPTYGQFNGLKNENLLGCSCVHKWPLPAQIFKNKRKRVKKIKRPWRREREM